MFNMIGNVFRNLANKPSTRNYPSKERVFYKGSRGKVKGIEVEKCIFCGICERKCPPEAIKVDRKEKSWEIDPFKCIVCGECAVICPKKCIIIDEEYLKPSDKKVTYKFNMKK